MIVSLTACENLNNKMVDNLDIQGHRGCRGLMPENTVAGFIKAIDLGVNTLEMDVVVNSNGDVFVSHEPFFNHEIAITPDGTEITEETEKSHNMYPLSVEEIKAYDVGSKKHPRFPIQKKMESSKPLLKEVVAASERYSKQNGITPLLYNIEIKRKAEHDGVYHPEMKNFADVVCAEIRRCGIMDRTTVQCFDVPTLQYIHETYPNVKLVYLIENTNPFEENLKLLGFQPEVYSPYFQLVTEDLLSYSKKKGMKVIPWTVNEVVDIEKLIDDAVDGIISDYPDKVIEIWMSKQKQH